MTLAERHEARMRLFIAIEAPEAWRRTAAEAQAALERALAPELRRQLRPVDPALMHLTLRFLGEVDEGGVDPLQAALDGHIEPFTIELALGDAGTSGPPQRTSVAWLGLAGDLDGLRSLAERVEQAVRVAGLPAEDRPLSPHLTLARVRRDARGVDRRAIAEALHALPAIPPAPATASEVLLIRSHLGDPRPRYEVLSRHG